MTAGLLDLAELAAEVGVAAPRRGWAVAAAARMLADAEDLGLDAGRLGTLAAAWRDGDCSGTHQGDAAGTLAAVVGLPDTEVSGAADQP